MKSDFNGAELRLARVFNGLSLDELAKTVDKTRQYIHRLETGPAVPTESLAQQLAAALRVESAFFYQVPAVRIHEDQFHFRKLFATKAGVKQMAMARGELIDRAVKCLDLELRLPEMKIPQIPNVQTFDEVERAAERCRVEWDLGAGPIGHMTRLAENVGAVVTSFSSISREIDALSLAVKRPIVVRNDAKESACRQRFDIGHELAHIALHNGIVTGDRVTETQANRFSGALLVPRAMMAKHFPKLRGTRLDWSAIRDFKLTWKISKAAALYRARQLDLIADQQYKSGIFTLRRQGEAVGERDDHLIKNEVPDLLPRSLQLLAEKKGFFAEDLASKLAITPSLLSDVFGFEVSPKPKSMSRPTLYLVN